ncbi:DUF998 domain-containing protein [Cryobacterium serini]|uniref:DUF998 domain-containing protein n=1 Tax=Cryobacterium serini TaxID=1259201 RepID=A0A4R9BVV4_9MICO|nr:DUF998 domain-containing protein [Cryobacterium serini]TFD90771.1 DUF998 domain-containing protein [Cryobacterium serini]
MAVTSMSPRALGVWRRRSATAAMVGVLLYVLVDVVLQFLPPHYSPISDAESNLAVGPYGWVMNVNFLGRAVTSGAAVGALYATARTRYLARVPSPRLLQAGLALFALGGVCSGVLAFFPTDVVIALNGAAAATAGHGVVAVTMAGTIHLVVATVGFVAALVAIMLLTAWLYRSGALPAARSLALAFTTLAVLGLLFLGLTLTVQPALFGLAERVCLLGILGWTYTVAAGIRRLD